MDTLQDLFKTIRREQRILKHMEKLRKNPVRSSPISRPSPASDLSLWSKGRIVQLIHQESGEILGCFQEYHHQTAGRRLLPIPTCPPTVTEIVHGAHWLAPQPAPIPEFNEYEVRSIHRRFLELMREYL